MPRASSNQTQAHAPGKGKAEPLDPREKLIAAAVELFSRSGYDSISTSTIAKRAGLTQSMVHYHFGSKSKLWESAIDHLMRERGAVFPIGRLDLQDLDPLARLKVIIRRFLSVNSADPRLHRIVMHESMARSPRLRWLAKRYMSVGYRMFDNAVTDAIEAKLLRPLPVVNITNIIVSACTMTSSLNFLIEEVYDVDANAAAFRESFSDSVVEIMFQGLQLPN